MKKHYRVTFDFVAEAKDITRESVEADYSLYTNAAELLAHPQIEEEAQIQTRLLQELQKDQEFVEGRLKSLVAFELSDLQERGMAQALSVEYDFLEYDHLLKYIQRLKKSDRDHFYKAKKNHLFSEHIEHIRSSFQAEIVSASIVELPG